MKTTTLNAIALILFAGVALGEPPVSTTPVPPQVRAAVAVALAEAEVRVASAVKPSRRPRADDCCVDIGEAKDACKKQSKPLVLWVGVRCENSPAVRDGLSDAVHCHQASYNGSSDPRLVVFRKDGTAVSFSAVSLDGKLVPAIRAEMWSPRPRTIDWSF